MQLTLSTGAVIQILGSSAFSFELGANVTAGDAAVALTYAQFVATLGAAIPQGAAATSGTSNFIVPTESKATPAASPSAPGSGTVLGTSGGDVMVFSGASDYRGGAGNDTYVISPYVASGNFTSTITDTEGVNRIQLVDGLTIAASSFFSNAVQLTLSTGAIVQIVGSSAFSFELGANITAGDAAVALTYAQFAAALGVAALPNASASTSGTPNFIVPADVTGSKAFTGIAVNDAPVLVNPIPDQGATAASTVTYTVPANTFSDVDSANLTYSATLDTGATLPNWLSFNPTTRAVSGTPAVANVGTINVKVTASDGSLSASDVFALAVTAVVNKPLTATTFAPLDEATSVAVGADVVVTFSESIQRGTGSIVLKTVAGVTIATYDAATSTNLTISGSTLTINPSADLAINTAYKVEFAAGSIKDVAGNAYAGTTSYNFTTVTIPANQPIAGSTSNDVLKSAIGNDTIDGGTGTDTVIFTGKITDYFIKYNRALGTATITDHRTGGDGTDSIKSIEKLQFSDKTFDLLNPARTESAAFGKSQSFLFDPAFYLLKNPDLVPTVTLATAFDSYKSKGSAAGAAPNAWFDPVYYANKWADLKALNLDAATLFAHYNLFGVWEGRSAGPIFDKFDGTKYLNDNPDVAGYVDAFVKDFLGSRSNGAIAHYVIYGSNEGRLAYDPAGVVIEQAILIGVPG